MRVWIETLMLRVRKMCGMVTLRVRVWIETLSNQNILLPQQVTLRVRVWIETDPCQECPVARVSPSA